MKSLDIYLHFPETVDLVRELFEKAYLTKIVNEISSLKQVLRTNKIRYAFFYDMTNFRNYISLIPGSDRDYLRDMNRRLLGSYSSDISLKRFPTGNGTAYRILSYSSYNLASPSICDIALFEGSTDSAKIILDIWGKPEKFRSVVKDVENDITYPQLSNFKLFVSIPDIIAFVEKDVAQNVFTLDDPARFIRTHKVYKASHQTIYKEVSTNYLWYLDYFHKDNKFHYEVFNSELEHVGEADVNGNILPGTADARKKLNI